MNPKGLRLGNWVLGNRPYQLDLRALNTHVGYLKMDKPGYFEPIPLTEEWLYRFGFDSYGLSRFECGDFCLLAYDDGFMLDTGGIEPDIEYVHQLQNLYFALIQKELTIKE